MFCRRCGNEIDDEARFCPRCGARAQAPEAAPEAAEAPASGATFAEAMDAARARSRRSVRVVALAALAAMLLSGAAWAAWTFYAEVVAPWIESRDAAVEQPAEDAAEEPAEQAAPAAAGEPQHVLQVAEILAMDPADVPAFLESQGLTAQQPNEEVLAIGYGAPATAWRCDYDDTAPFRALDERGVDVEPQERPGNLPIEVKGPTVIFGKDVMPPHDLGLFDIDGYDLQKSDLMNGIEPTAIHIDNLPLPLLDDEATRALIEACSLPEASASFRTDSVFDKPPHAAIHVGFIDIDDERYCWYIGQDPWQDLSWVQGFMGCCPVSAVEKTVVDAQLYTESEWLEADDSTKALMVGQSILQGLHMSNGGYRGNLVTGEYETSYNASLTGTDENGLPQPERRWVTEAELRELAGDKVADSYFSFLKDRERKIP